MYLLLFLIGPGAIALFVILALILIVVAASIRIVPQANSYVIEKFGSYCKTWSTGIHFLWPVVYRISKKVSLKEQVIDFPPQPVITKDNVTMQIDTVIFLTITDPKAYAYGHEKPILAVEKLSATTLRNIIGDIDLDSTLTSRDLINAKMREILDDATDTWGIKVNRVELQNILPPKDIRDAMEKQMRAERERRESILQAEGIKQAQILKAEGEKQSAILAAEGKKQTLIQEAEGAKQAEILAAEGHAQAILTTQSALAEGIKLIREANADQAVLTLKAFDALKDMANGTATKIIVPTDLQGLAGLATSLKEIVSK